MVPPDLTPELSGIGALYRVIYLHIELDALPAWTNPPPIPYSIAENIRIYSWATVDDPKVRRDVYRAMEHSRRNKRVRYLPDAPIARQFSDLYERKFFAREDYFADGEIDGLDQFSQRRCFTSAELVPNPAEPRYLGWKMAVKALQQKADDDPAPPGCVTNRSSTILINKPNENSATWIWIECRPVLQNCTVSFIAAQRIVEVDFDHFDLRLWRQIVEPVRQRIDQLVTEPT